MGRLSPSSVSSTATGRRSGLADEDEVAGPFDAPGSGGVRYHPIPFALAGLTDRSRHQAAVVRRAQKLFQAARHGLFPPIGFRTANLSDVDNLAFQGLIRGGDFK